MGGSTISAPAVAAALVGGTSRGFGDVAALCAYTAPGRAEVWPSRRWWCGDDVSIGDMEMALSRAALGGVYSRRHVLGGATSVMGLAILVLTDAYVRGANDAGSNPALGDFIVLLAAFGYASSNVLQEAALLDGASAVEVLAHVGGFGAVFSGIQCLALEIDSLARLNATAGAAGIAELATFAASLFAPAATLAPPGFPLGGAPDAPLDSSCPPQNPSEGPGAG